MHERYTVSCVCSSSMTDYFSDSSLFHAHPVGLMSNFSLSEGLWCVLPHYCRCSFTSPTQKESQSKDASLIYEPTRSGQLGHTIRITHSLTLPVKQTERTKNGKKNKENRGWRKKKTTSTTRIRQRLTFLLGTFFRLSQSARLSSSSSFSYLIFFSHNCNFFFFFFSLFFSFCKFFSNKYCVLHPTQTVDRVIVVKQTYLMFIS